MTTTLTLLVDTHNLSTGVKVNARKAKVTGKHRHYTKM